jgi:phosphonate transport system ATP-binding protein
VILSFQHVGVRYPGSDALAVQDVSFTVRPGERVGLLGSSGSGKTTLLNVAAGLVPATHGVVLRDDVPLDGMSSKARRQSDAHVGMVHQQLNLVRSLSVINNVNAGLLGQWSTMRALRSLWVKPHDVVGVQTILDRLGIADKATSRVADLSGGQQQRVALARVLRQEPSLLLADEPVSAVDPAWSEEVLTVLSTEVATRGAALLLSLHDVGLAQRWCDRLIGLRSGEVVFDLPANQVTAAQLSGLYDLQRNLLRA